MKEKYEKMFDEVIARKSNSCDSWEDSGDRGACYAHEVAPWRELKGMFDNLEAENLKLKQENEILISELDDYKKGCDK